MLQPAATPSEERKGRITLDLEQMIKPLILLGFSILLFYLVISGQIRMYINPRFAILDAIAAAALFLMFAVQLFYTHRRDHADNHCDHKDAPRPWVYVIFIIPLALAALLPNAVLGASVAYNRGLNFDNAQPGSGVLVQADANGIDPSGSGSQQTDNSGISKSGLINVTDDNFVRAVSAITQSPGLYTGREISMLGFVIRAKDFAPQEFGLTRFIITCCTADAMPGGFILESKEAVDYKDGTWINIRGVMKVDNYDQQVVPVIEVTSIELATQPPDPYVYP